MTGETENKPHGEEDYKALVDRLQKEIKKLQKENESLQKDLNSKLEYIEELITSIGNPKDRLTEDAVKYIHDKYMLEVYHESKTKPIKKR